MSDSCNGSAQSVADKAAAPAAVASKLWLDRLVHSFDASALQLDDYLPEVPQSAVDVLRTLDVTAWPLPAVCLRADVSAHVVRHPEAVLAARAEGLQLPCIMYTSTGRAYEESLCRLLQEADEQYATAAVACEDQAASTGAKRDGKWFHEQVRAGNMRCVAIHRILAKQRCVINAPRLNLGKGWVRINALSYIEKLFDLKPNGGSPKLLRYTVEVLRGAWPKLKGEVPGVIFSAIGGVLQEQPFVFAEKAKRDMLVTALCAHDPRKLRDRAKAIDERNTGPVLRDMFRELYDAHAARCCARKGVSAGNA